MCTICELCRKVQGERITFWVGVKTGRSQRLLTTTPVAPGGYQRWQDTTYYENVHQCAVWLCPDCVKILRARLVAAALMVLLPIVCFFCNIDNRDFSQGGPIIAAIKAFGRASFWIEVAGSICLAIVLRALLRIAWVANAAKWMLRRTTANVREQSAIYFASRRSNASKRGVTVYWTEQKFAASGLRPFNKAEPWR
jgi:hypothetical protein